MTIMIIIIILALGQLGPLYETYAEPDTPWGPLLAALGGIFGHLWGIQIDPRGMRPCGCRRLGALFDLFLFVLLDSSSSIFFGLFVSLLLEPLQVDFELPR